AHSTGVKQPRPAATDHRVNDDAVLVDEPQFLERWLAAGPGAALALGHRAGEHHRHQIALAGGADLLVDPADQLSRRLGRLLEAGRDRVGSPSQEQQRDRAGFDRAQAKAPGQYLLGGFDPELGITEEQRVDLLRSWATFS